MTNKDLATEYAKAFNNLDIAYIEEHLAEDFKYTSQKVFSQMESKAEYLDYLKGKFSTLKKSQTKLIARMGLFRGESCFALYQIDLSKKSKTETATLLMEYENGKIKSACMCMIPSISEIELLDELPC
ncbi:nuclear transport factor 2-like protein [Pontimicrobium aquaticum]|uniref:Nuclear transport factor 2 family protein n=1 Tax=Pontimicrobium aquaticum TaxID=2565367 RepID=A0A4V5LQN0_9FLAO|nr:hypothetical protein [Pontimicrobium aquaticum]TJY35899.1 hypothetical protein E5167_08505 [Pontimicrobium aquaticum]